MSIFLLAHSRSRTGAPAGFIPPVDVVKPTIDLRTPTVNETNVPLSATIQATFSERVTGIVWTLKDHLNNTVAATPSFDDTTFIATLEPTGDLLSGETYTVTISGAVDASGNLLTTVSWSFSCVTVQTDTAPPVATIQSPTPNATNVLEAAVIAAQFNEPVQPGTISLVLKDHLGVTKPGTTTYNPNNFTVTHTPTTGMVQGETYTATLSGALDLAGNPMTSLPWSFTIGDVNAPTVTVKSPASNATNVAVGSTLSATFSEAVTGVIWVVKDHLNNTKAGSATYNSGTNTSTWTPTTALANAETYTATVSGAIDASSNPMVAINWSFTTVSAASPPESVFAPGVVPTNPADLDVVATETGVKFQVTADGILSGIRYYKSSTNTGTHVGSLWTRTGTLLAQATFAGESTTGWQQVSFTTPVSITANTTYVASVHCVNGHYAGDTGYFTNAAKTNGHITLLKEGTDGSNGVYIYNANPTFPNLTFQSTNYYVDVVFTPGTVADTTAPLATVVSPSPNATAVSRTTTVVATFNEDIVYPGTVSFVLTDPSTSVVPSSLAYNSGTRTITLTPTSTLGFNTTYLATLGGAKDAAGNQMTSVPWSFTTVSAGGSPPAGPNPAWFLQSTGLSGTNQQLQGVNIQNDGGYVKMVELGAKVARMNVYFGGGSVVDTSQHPFSTGAYANAINNGIVPYIDMTTQQSLGQRVTATATNTTTATNWAMSVMNYCWTNSNANCRPVFELDNEPNGGANGPAVTAAEYMTKMTSIYNALKASSISAAQLCGPHEYGFSTVGGASPESGQLAFHTGFCTAANFAKIDRYAYHVYKANAERCFLMYHKPTVAALTAIRANLLFHIGETGQSTAGTGEMDYSSLAQETAVYSFSPFLWRGAMNLKQVTYYVMKDPVSSANYAGNHFNAQGFYTNATVAKGSMPAVMREGFDFIHHVIAAKIYCDKSGTLASGGGSAATGDHYGNLWAVQMTHDTLGQALAVRYATAAQTTASKTIGFWSDVAGTLKVKTVGVAGTTDHVVTGTGYQSFSQTVGNTALLMTHNCGPTFYFNDARP